MPSPTNREEALFQAASQLTGAERASFLNGACLGDDALRQRLDALLVAHDEPDDLSPKDKPAAVATIKLDMSDAPDEAVGQTLGNYKLLQKIGEGGCGAVYMAEQEHPVRRRVALKVIKLGMDTKNVIARFEAERQALALMDHPNIAKVLDAGATDVGRPFFVMELVRGIKITDYCDQNNLDTNQRLGLFIQICQAIQHAHQKGIIHRDIKPSNILVTMHDGVPVPKVIDFGIAKATTDQRLTDKTLFTAYEQFIGTPAYMSPEQAEMSGLDIDTRSDIYSLGVLLYELLTGRTPFDAKELMNSGIDAMRKTIREREPQRPSTKLHTLQGDDLTTTARRHGVEASRLMSLLRGDLDWIVMKCLEKDRTRRYETANGIAADLKRHLNNEAIVARPPSAAYRFQKSFRRNKLAFAAACAIAATLLFGIIIATSQAIRATHAKREAQAAQASEKVQRQMAEANEQKAVAAQKAEAAAELIARQRAYASDMNVAKQALDENNLGRALDLLNRQRPQPGQQDLRGWEWRYLWQQTRSDALFTLCQQSSEISSLAVSPDGHWLAVGVAHKDGLFVYDLQTRQQVAHLAQGEDMVRAAFSPAGTVLAFTSEKARSALHLWNATTRQMMAEFPLDHLCVGLAFSKDGKTLVTSTEHGHITLWQIPDGTKLASYASQQGFAGPATTPFATTPELKFAAYGLSRQRICVVDLRDGKELWTAVASKAVITALAFSPDGKTLASAAGFGEKDIRLWDVATGKQIGTLEGHGSYVSSLVFWPDGKKLASSSGDQTIRIWDVASQKCLDVLRGHLLEVYRVALLPDDKMLVSGGKDGTVCFWDTSVLHPRSERVTLPDHIAAWQFSPDSQSVLTLNRNQQRQVKRWSGNEFQQQELLLDAGTNFISSTFNTVFSQDGRFLASGSDNGVIRVWDLSRHVLWRQWTNTSSAVYPLKFLGDGNKLITGSESDKLVHEWDLITGRELQSWRAISGNFYTVASPDENRFVETKSDGEVQFKNLVNGRIMETNLDFLEGDKGAISPDGRLFAIPSHIGYARVWNTTTWQEIKTLRGYLVGLSSVAFSPDGRRLATGSDQQEALRLWDTESWQDVLTLEGQGADFDLTAFSPDGNSVGAMSDAGILHVWRAPSWAEINAVEVKDPPSPSSGATGKMEDQQP
ncbi:MAG TPA: serine/threonine-protein kinase [Verrucomicrobiae bacterium]